MRISRTGYLTHYRCRLASLIPGPLLCNTMVADRVACLQLNTHKAQLAHIELLHVLDEHPETICFIQEPYVYVRESACHTSPGGGLLPAGCGMPPNCRLCP